MKSVRLAIVDDSSFVREGIVRLLSSEARIIIVGTAASGEELLENLDSWQPDCVTLDLNMPGMDGLETLDRLMEHRATPVIILSTLSGEGAPLTLKALSKGAVDFIDKEAYSLVDFHALRSVLVEKILSVTQSTAEQEQEVTTTAGVPASAERKPISPAEYDLVVIGASTGGPSAIERVLTDIKPGIPAPIIIAQHMPARFTSAFAERLNWQLPMRVREAGDHERISGGTVYIAPGDLQLSLERDGDNLYASVYEPAKDATYHPSVDILFASAAEVLGGRVVAALLTGMGDDGAEGMARLARARAYTIAQDQASCVVYGMPRAAVSLNAAREVLSLNEVGTRIRQLFG